MPGHVAEGIDSQTSLFDAKNSLSAVCDKIKTNLFIDFYL